ncbi:trypsin-like serine protease, putative [Nostoc sp. NIES-3756]|uniref:S1 family peptidase n=1 Tax=Nostoc sp. NIES-3756 TaxID=1751286 RepID=UPI000721E3A0|nr:serine protease [Nostoc sp. NIES-3756]BAT56119.1 trypsin-like serine protease, putative [Nostoc sp. NIES-3756]
MGFSNVSVISLISCLCFVPSAQAVYSTYQERIATAPEISQSSEGLSINDLRARSRAITVKIMAGETWGSGIIIERRGQVYTVLTNAHVLRIGDNYRIQTADGRTYSGRVSRNVNFNDEDLAIINFESSRNYAIASIAQAPIKIGDETFASGFPNDTNDWLFTIGKIEYLLPQSFQGGYQIGYSNDIFKGMSGGPVLNRRGELVAINGRHKHPLWGNPFVFLDGSTPVAKIRTQFEESSWAVPVERFLRRIPAFAQGAVDPKAELPYPSVPVTPQPPIPTNDIPIPANSLNRSGWVW